MYAVCSGWTSRYYSVIVQLTFIVKGYENATVRRGVAVSALRELRIIHPYHQPPVRNKLGSSVANSNSSQSPHSSASSDCCPETKLELDYHQCKWQHINKTIKPHRATARDLYFYDGTWNAASQSDLLLFMVRLFRAPFECFLAGIHRSSTPCTGEIVVHKSRIDHLRTPWHAVSTCQLGVL